MGLHFFFQTICPYLWKLPPPACLPTTGVIKAPVTSAIGELPRRTYVDLVKTTAPWSNPAENAMAKEAEKMILAFA